MTKLLRNPDKVSKENFDLIIIGGGIQGAMLALESTLIGLKPLLLEKNDFGAATSFNSLRIIHGGFRYLQSMNYSRLSTSAEERRWFLRNFPDLVTPFPCMVPLYDKKLRRTSILKVALSLYNLLTLGRNKGVQNNQHIPSSKVISASETSSAFPMVDSKGLKGGAIWYDGFLENSQRLIIEVLRMATNNGAVVLNYMEAKELDQHSNQVSGVKTLDAETKKEYLFNSKTIINASGPWCRELAEKFDRDHEPLFNDMIAWNILFDRKPISNHGVAIESKGKKSHTYFLVPWKDKLLAGTGHAPWLKSSKKPMPTTEQINHFISDLNQAIPGINLTSSEIIYVLPGLQSATKKGGHKLSSKEIIFDHSKKGGPTGLFSISGVKMTTSRLMAEKTLRFIFPKELFQIKNKNEIYKNLRDKISRHWEFSYQWQPSDDKWLKQLRTIIDEEAVIHLDDLVFQRTTLWENPQRVIELAPIISKLFNWSDDRSTQEINNIHHLIKERSIQNFRT